MSRQATASHVSVDRVRSAERIATDVRTLAAAPFTSSPDAVRRYAYTPEYRRTLDYLSERLRELDFEVHEDPIGNLVAQNAPRGARVYGIGSHVDSVRNGGAWDGTLGVVVALEICRLVREHDLDLPLRVISFLEEEGAGFGQMLLGSRVAAGRVQEAELRAEFCSIDDGRPFWEHAAAAGHEPARWRECADTLDGLDAWVETHIEQARQLQDGGQQIGIVDAIAGYIHGDLVLTGRADHAGGTPMGLRSDAFAMAAEVALELERIATTVGGGTVGTIGEVRTDPGVINVIPGEARLSLDVRGPDDRAVQRVVDGVAGAAQAVAARRDGTVRCSERQRCPATPMDGAVVSALAAAAEAAGVRHRRIVSGAAHDTMCVADRAPCAMVFVPCRDGVSHSPLEEADPADAAVAAEVVLNALLSLDAARAA